MYQIISKFLKTFLAMTFKYFLIEEDNNTTRLAGDKLRPELYSVLMRFSITEISLEPSYITDKVADLNLIILDDFVLVCSRQILKFKILNLTLFV